jgi:hypothetical protein
MKTLTNIFIIMIMSFNLLTAQNIVFKKTYTSQQTPNNSDHGYSLKQTADSGYILLGDQAIYKTDINGNMVWENNLYTPGFRGRSVEVTSDGYLFCGSSYTGGGNFDIWVEKRDLSGNLAWHHSYGSNSSYPYNAEYGFSIKKTFDNGFIIAG